jgi:hypothetical protein
MQRYFNQGDILLRQGDPSDCVFRINSGTVEILREVGDITIVLGSVFAGQFVGEMGVIEKRPRSATARAITEVEAEQLSRGARCHCRHWQCQRHHAKGGSIEDPRGAGDAQEVGAGSHHAERLDNVSSAADRLRRKFLRVGAVPSRGSFHRDSP